MAEAEPYTKFANEVAGASDADVLLINGPISRPLDFEVLNECRARARRRPNVILILVTSGGDANAAYRVSRYLQDAYKGFTMFVTGYCKSAGTIVALGATELIFADSGELGPTDVQMAKPDELAAKQSGLTATSALATMNLQAFESFESFFLQLVHKSGSAISTKTATQLAAQLVCGLFAPLYGHIDPMHVGEAGRALLIVEKYGQLLQNKANNLKPGSLQALATDYPSHGFVIDRDEASRLFQNVRKPTKTEQALLDSLKGFAINPIEDEKKRVVVYLSDELPVQPEPDGAPSVAGGSSNDAKVDPQQAQRGAPKANNGRQSARTPE